MLKRASEKPECLADRTSENNSRLELVRHQGDRGSKAWVARQGFFAKFTKHSASFCWVWDGGFWQPMGARSGTVGGATLVLVEDRSRPWSQGSRQQRPSQNIHTFHKGSKNCQHLMQHPNHPKAGGGRPGLQTITDSNKGLIKAIPYMQHDVCK